MPRWLLAHFTGRCWLPVELYRVIDDEMRQHRMRSVSELTAIPLVAFGDVHMQSPWFPRSSTLRMRALLLLLLSRRTSIGVTTPMAQDAPTKNAP